LQDLWQEVLFKTYIFRLCKWVEPAWRDDGPSVKYSYGALAGVESNNGWYWGGKPKNYRGGWLIQICNCWKQARDRVSANLKRAINFTNGSFAKECRKKTRKTTKSSSTIVKARRRITWVAYESWKREGKLKVKKQ